jgi:hypothetical protein
MGDTMPDKTYKATAKQFDLFKKTVALWVEKLGLREWRLEVELDDEDKECKCYGYCNSNWNNRTASIGMVETTWHKLTDVEVKRTARHEVMELMMQPLWHVCLDREFNYDHGCATRHEVIRRLENLFDRDD